MGEQPVTQDQIQQILAAITPLQTGLARLETKVDNLAKENVDAEKVHDDHETRLRATEHHIATSSGESMSVTKARATQLAIVCSVLGGGIGFVLSHLWR